LILRYAIRGDLTHLAVPEFKMPRRADELWQHTCFEAFIGSPDRDEYLELNFSPSTEWAAYRFSGYREGMAHADDTTARVQIQESAEQLQVVATVELPVISIGRSSLALSAVIEDANGHKSYWALAHPPGKADFHQRAGFVASLP
jgi:hypothetical protein